MPLTEKEKKFYDLIIEKLEEEKKEKEIFRHSSKFYELVILYTSLLFIVLAQWYVNDIQTSIIFILLLSSALSTVSLLTVIIGHTLMRYEKPFFRQLEQFFHRFSLGCFFMSVFLLFIDLFIMVYEKIGCIMLSLFLFITIFIIIFIAVFVSLYTYFIIIPQERKRRRR